MRYRGTTEPRREGQPGTGSLRWLGAILVIAGTALAGCAGVQPEPAAAGKPEAVDGAITITDDASADARARADFRAALELLEAGDYEKAVGLLEQVVERSPKAIAPRVNLAIAYAELDKPEPAEASLKHALEVNPTHPVVNNEYAMLLRKAGRFSEAKVAYETALQAYPDFHPVRKNLGILCDLYLNDPVCALQHYEVYAKALPEDEEVQHWIVDLQRRVGD